MNIDNRTNDTKKQNYGYKNFSAEEKQEREDDLILGFMNKNHEYVLERLDPLFKSQLRGISLNHQDDFLQEYWILTTEVVEETKFNEEL